MADMADENGFADVVKVLVENDIPCIGPEFGKLLLNIKVEIEKTMKKVESPEVRETLEAYSAALMVVCTVAALHQASVITTLAKLLEQFPDAGLHYGGRVQ